MKHILFLIGMLSFISCKKEDEHYGSYINSTLFLKVQDNEGNNLLDNTTAGHYSYEEIKTFILEDGKIVEYLGKDLYKSKMVGYYKDALKLHLACPNSNNERQVTFFDTYIQFGNRPKDKITGWFNVGPGFCRLDSAYYNDKLIYKENPNAKEEVFPIIQIEPNSR